MAIIHIPVLLQQFTNYQEKICTHQRSLKDVLNELIAEYPALKPYLVDSQGNPACHVNFYFNNQDYRSLEANTQLGETDSLTIILAMAGG